MCGASLFATIVIVPFDMRTDRLIEAHTRTHARARTRRSASAWTVNADMLIARGTHGYSTSGGYRPAGGCPNPRVAYHQAANARTDQTLALPAAKPSALSATTDKANPSADTSTSLKHR